MLRERAVPMEVLTLPCQRERHGSCAGGVRLGIARYAHEHVCFCLCHQVASTSIDLVGS